MWWVELIYVWQSSVQLYKFFDLTQLFSGSGSNLYNKFLKSFMSFSNLKWTKVEKGLKNRFGGWFLSGVMTGETYPSCRTTWEGLLKFLVEVRPKNQCPHRGKVRLEATRPLLRSQSRLNCLQPGIFFHSRRIIISDVWELFVIWEDI